MRKLLYFAFFVNFVFFGGVNSETISMNWLNEDGTLSQTTTCEAGGDIILPTAPTKRGYTFIGWYGYTQIEYLESTGTQYIDTGIVFSQSNSRVVIKYEYDTVGGNQSIAGAQPSYFFIPYVRGDLSFYHSGLDSVLHTNITANTLYLLEMTQKNNVFTININGAEQSLKCTPLYPRYSYFLFATSNGYNAMEFAVAKIYFVQMYENDSLIRDFIPMLDENNIPCMYDKVTNQCFYNAGTGQFIAGPVVGSDQ